jgi:uncharacterized protein YjdB
MRSINRFLKILSFIFLGMNPVVHAQTTTFSYSGSVQTFTAIGSSISVTAVGGLGGEYSVPRGGYGGKVVCTLAVTAGTVYEVYVGGAGGSGFGGTAGFNGGGAANEYAGGGGGASDVRYPPYGLTNRLVVAGGGGGGTANYGIANYDRGGNGGGLTGEQGYTDDVYVFTTNYGAYGGTQISGGAGGYWSGYSIGGAGGFGVGGSGASGTWGPGGGGGYYGGGGGSWTGGGGGSSYTDPVLATGVTHTQGYNTVGDGSVAITNLCTIPTSGPITGSPTVCVAATTVYSTSTTAGGVWTSTDPTIASIGSSSGIITGVSPGTAVISYSIILSCGSAFASAVITVNPVPLPIVYDTIVCAGSTVTFTDPTPGGSWTSWVPAVASIDPSTGVATGITSGSSIITYELSTGCFVTSPPLTVLLIPTGISGPTSICMGYPVTFTETATGGAWSSSDTSIASVDSFSGLVTPVSTGSVIIGYTNGCGSGAYLPITVNPLPDVITGVFSACEGLTTTLSDSTAGGLWSSSTTSIATVNSTSGVVTGVSGGFATIVYTLPTSCFVTATVDITPPPAPITGPSSVCDGDSITLVETVTGGFWTGSDSSLASVSSTGVVRGISLGVIHVTYSIGTGCNAIKTVTVNPIAPVAGRDSVCLGSTGYLTDIVGGGTWTSQYPSIATISVDSGLVYGVSAGIASITYTLPTGCSASANMTVIAQPPAIIAAITSVCPGSSISLSDAIGGGTWVSVNNLIATVNPATGVVTGVGADTVTIYYSIAPGCITTLPILVNPLPAPIFGSEILCPGTQDTLTDASAGGVWSSTNTALATVSSGGVVTAVGLSGGVATIKYTLPTTGCDVTTTVSIRQAPSPSINYIDGTMYTDTGYVSYQWYDSILGLLPGATSPNCAALYTEYYYVVVTDSNGCKGVSAFFEFNASGLGVKNIPTPSYGIYPNPTDGMVYISTPAAVRVVVSGIDGKKLLEVPNAKSLDVGSLPPGVYFIGLYDDNNQILTLQKLIKQ